MDAAKPNRVALSRELSEFLIELSIAVQKHAMYPGAHPSLAAAVTGLTGRARRLLDDRPTLVFGVARRQLIIDGVATDPDQPVLRRLAEGLHRHHLGAVSLSRGLEVDELEQALRALSLEVEKHGPLGLAPPGRMLEWSHVRLHPLTFDRLELVSVAPDGAPDDKTASGRAVELWIGLARAAMATNDRAETPADAVAAEPAAVARAIDEHEGATAYDQVIIGYLLQIARELQTASGGEAATLRTRTARLIAALRPETLRRLIEMGGDKAQRREFVLNAASGMAVDSVIDILKAAAEASGQTISHGLTRMLSKLATHAELGNEQIRPLADGALREQVGRLLSGWELADPNPDAYSKVLQHIAHAAPAADRRTATPIDDQDGLRLMQMILEVGDVGPAADRAMNQALGAGWFGALLRLLASVPPEGDAVAGRLRSRLTSPAAITALTAHERFDAEALDQLLPLLSAGGYNVLLDALAESASRSTRRRLLDRLAHAPVDIAPLVIARLNDRRWFVVRNMLVLLQRLPLLPAGFTPAPWARHADSRVRHEALVLQLAIPGEREAALRAALDDADPRTLRVGALAAQADCPSSAVPLLARIALNTRLADELRQLAIRALGRAADTRARDALLALLDGGRTLLGRPKLAPTGPVCIAALGTLAERWPHDAVVAPTLALAASSPDPVMRQAVARRGDSR